jgi:ADP-ribosylation factor-like protein 6
MPFFNKLFTFLGIKKREVNILVVGLDNSGKTTVLNRFKNQNEEAVNDVVPTVGFNVEKFKFGSLAITAFDMSGQGRYRNLWERYFKGVAGIIFVVDSTDTLRMVVAKDELDMMLNHKDLKENTSLPILFLANKVDLEDSMSASKIGQLLGLDHLRNPCHIQSTNALSGEGLEEGIHWLEQQVLQNYSK